MSREKKQRKEVKIVKQLNFGDMLIKNIHIDYEHRLKSITYEDAAKRVFDRLGYVKTKSGVGMMWTKRTKSTYFLDKKGKVVAIYSKTIRDFWWV